MCLRGLLKCVESGEGEHPDGGLPRPRPARGKRRRREQPAPSRDPRLRRPGLIPCALRCFLGLTRREGRGGNPCGCPLTIANIVVSCRWLPHFLGQLTRRLSMLWKWVSSELRLTTWVHCHAGRDQERGSRTILFPKLARSPAPRPCKGSRGGLEGGAEFAGKGAELCWFLKAGLQSWGDAAPPLPDSAGLLLGLSEFSAVCFSSPFTFLQLVPTPHVALGDAVQATRGGALLSPGCISHVATRH